jgi:hypothetical protein
VWKVWADTGTTSSTTTTYSTTTSTVWVDWTHSVVEVKETRKQKETRLKREAEQRAQWEKEAEEKRKIEAEKSARALALLMLLLDSQQKKQLKEKKSFELVSVKTGNRYRVREGIAGNVDLLDENGAVKKTLCFHPDGFHQYDVMAQQALMLEHDEEQVANIVRMPELMRAVNQN